MRVASDPGCPKGTRACAYYPLMPAIWRKPGWKWAVLWLKRMRSAEKFCANAARQRALMWLGCSGDSRFPYRFFQAQIRRNQHLARQITRSISFRFLQYNQNIDLYQ
jgi:hypothetical protein